MRRSASSAPVAPALGSEVAILADDLEVPEVRFDGTGVRGKYYLKALEAKGIVQIEDDVRAVFPDAAAVNEALRTLIRLRASGSERPW